MIFLRWLSDHLLYRMKPKKNTTHRFSLSIKTICIILDNSIINQIIISRLLLLLLMRLRKSLSIARQNLWRPSLFFHSYTLIANVNKITTLIICIFRKSLSFCHRMMSSTLLRIPRRCASPYITSYRIYRIGGGIVPQHCIRVVL